MIDSFSENLLAIQAPSTTRCDFCQVSFCGIGIPGRCLAAPLTSQHPHGMSDIGDLIQSAEVYECFDCNTVEVEIMLDYLTTQRLSPRHIYREVRSPNVQCTNSRSHLIRSYCIFSLNREVLRPLLSSTSLATCIASLEVLTPVQKQHEIEYADCARQRSFSGGSENGGFVRDRKVSWKKP